MLQDLPQELVEFIIDHLCDDTKALKSCKLACRRWLERSRYHHFRSVTLKFPSHPMKLLQIISDNPAVATLIRKIIIYPVIGRQIRTDSAPLESLFLKTTHLLACLPNLKALHPCNFALSYGPHLHRFMECCQKASHSISILDLDHVSFLNAQDIINIVSCFPNLEHLIWNGSILMKTLPTLLQIPSHSLTHIEVRQAHTLFPLLPWMKSFASQINSLDVSPITPETFDNFTRILEIFGPTLTHLNMQSDGYGLIDDRERTFQFLYDSVLTDYLATALVLAGSLTSLEHIDIGLLSLGASHVYVLTDNNWIHQAFSNIRSETLVAVKLSIRILRLMGQWTWKYDFDWKKFEDAMIQHSFGSLTSITLTVEIIPWRIYEEGRRLFKISVGPVTVSVSNILRSLVPRLDLQGIVNVVILNRDVALPYYRIE
jgi:hypothetical protein